MNIVETVKSLFARRNKRAAFLARQMLLLNTPLSKAVELYLYDNEGAPQSLELFPMMRPIYDSLPQRLLLKCSRKTLKSTLISNVITLNMVRYNYYKMLYVGPNEQFTKYFSSSYLAARFDSPRLKAVIQGLSTNDVFKKVLRDTHSDVLLKYANDDATRIRGPATDHNIHDEVQDMDLDILPIIGETMALSGFKREIFAGTPLTTDNTIQSLWKKAHQYEWAMKCRGCNHWNTLTMDNDPLKMILKQGFSCAKCSKLINSEDGQWIDFNPGDRAVHGYHLAQPLLPFFNRDPKEWREIFAKCTGEKNYTPLQVYNEVLGLAHDVGAKPITEEQLKSLCVLGEADSAWERGRRRYVATTMGVDWGVNMQTSRTTGCCVGLREDGICEVFFAKVFKDTDYESQIGALARKAGEFDAFVASDSGPDPARGIMLAKLYNPQKCQLVRYEHGKFVQRQDVPADAIDWSQTRWVLHRSDTFSFTLDLLRKNQIVFPRWEDCSEAMQDILNIFVEVKEGPLRAELFYRHKDDQPDDFFHALNFAICQAHLLAGNPLLQGASSSSQDAASSG